MLQKMAVIVCCLPAGEKKYPAFFSQHFQEAFCRCRKVQDACLRFPLGVFGFCCFLMLLTGAHGDEKIAFRNDVIQASITADGGAIVEFRFVDQQINPLNWEIEDLEPRTIGQPYLRGHFLCLDRWGAPSEAETRYGVPFHGEAPRVVWQITKRPQKRRDLKSVAQMNCTLPLAGMRVHRIIKLSAGSAMLSITEEVTNTNLRGRIYNMVQHPTIAPPFLDDATVVDSNAGAGFWQEGVVPVIQCGLM